MKILVLCAHGNIRSQHLAKYLTEQGYETDFDGVENEASKVQKKIDAAEAIVTVSDRIREKLEKDFAVEGKKIVGLKGNPENEYDLEFLTDEMEKQLPINQAL